MSSLWSISLLACTSSSQGPLDAEAFEAALQDVLVETGAPGVALAVSVPADPRRWVGTAGLAQIEGEVPWASRTPYPIGSVTKTFTAAWILQLEEEGVLGLDDAMDDWVTTPWRGEGITLRHLMQHTSGVASYNYVGGFDGSVPYTPTELLDWAYLHEPALQFTPGSRHVYSNTGYILLGMIGETATGQLLQDAIEERFTQPLGLGDTYLATNHPPDLVHGYRGDPLYDATEEMNPTAGWAAGGIVSTPADVATWGAALFSGAVVSPATLDVMTTPLLVDGVEVGHGLGLFGGVDADWGSSWGHTGGYSGQLTYMYYMEDPDRVVVAMVNSFEVDLEAVANAAWFEILDLN